MSRFRVTTEVVSLHRFTNITRPHRVCQLFGQNLIQIIAVYGFGSDFAVESTEVGAFQSYIFKNTALRAIGVDVRYELIHAARSRFKPLPTVCWGDMPILPNRMPRQFRLDFKITRSSR